MSDTARNNVKQLTANIEALARDVQSKLDNGSDFLVAANELVRNNLTLVFTLGEFYALQQTGSTKTVKGTKVSAGTSSYHNVRDSRGRFCKA